MDVNAGEKIRVGLEFGTTEVGLDEDGELAEGHDDPTAVRPDENGETTKIMARLETKGPLSWISPCRRLHLETTGAFWHGGPELVTTIGDINVEFNDYVATLSDGNGVKVEGIEVRPVNARAFYAWDEGQVGAAADAHYAGIDLGAAIVTDGEDFEAAGTAGTEISGVKVTAEGAVDKISNLAYKLTGETELMPNVTVKGSYRDSGELRKRVP